MVIVTVCMELKDIFEGISRRIFLKEFQLWQKQFLGFNSFVEDTVAEWLACWTPDWKV